MIDTHAHLLCYENKDELINSMESDGLSIIVNVGTTLKDSIEGIEIAKKHKNIYTTVGIYPEYAGETTQDDIDQIKKLATQDKVVAIGEIGLDYHNEGFDAKKQKELFIKQLEIANDAGLPFCIHCRGAVEDVYQILSSHKHLLKHSGLMHCYSEGKDWVQKFIGLGMYISFSGNITFRKSDRSFLKDVPLDRLLVETDAPYLSPEPVRGRKNEPKNVAFVAKRIAQEIGLSFEELEKITTENALRFYYKIDKN